MDIFFWLARDIASKVNLIDISHMPYDPQLSQANRLIDRYRIILDSAIKPFMQFQDLSANRQAGFLTPGKTHL